MIKFNGIPATPGSLESSPELDKVLGNGTLRLEEIDSRLSGGPITLEQAGKSIGATLLGNVDPPTPIRVVEVAYPLVERDIVPPKNGIVFMGAVLQGAMQRAQRLADI